MFGVWGVVLGDFRLLIIGSLEELVDLVMASSPFLLASRSSLKLLVNFDFLFDLPLKS